MIMGINITNVNIEIGDHCITILSGTRNVRILNVFVVLVMKLMSEV